jgi:hypothetical protein
MEVSEILEEILTEAFGALFPSDVEAGEIIDNPEANAGTGSQQTPSPVTFEKPYVKVEAEAGEIIDECAPIVEIPMGETAAAPAEAASFEIPHTKNEVMPDLSELHLNPIEYTQDPLVEFGKVQHYTESTLVIESIPGRLRAPLDLDSVVCTGNG